MALDDKNKNISLIGKVNEIAKDYENDPRYIPDTLPAEAAFEFAQEEDYERGPGESPPPIRGPYTFSQFVLKNTLCKPCACSDIFSCKCLNTECKRKNLFRYHKQGQCTFPPHSKFEESGYFWTEKPVWKYSCKRTFDDETAAGCEEIWNARNFQCDCTSFESCYMCHQLLLTDGKLFLKRRKTE